jgi:hypothetical protein
VSLISLQLFEKLPPDKVIKLDVQDTDHFRAVDGRKFTPIKKIKCELRIVNPRDPDDVAKDQCIFYVVDNLDLPMLLGDKHIRQFLYNYNFAASTYEINPENFVQIPVKITHGVILPPQSTAFIELTAETSNTTVQSFVEFQLTATDKTGRLTPLWITPFRMDVGNPDGDNYKHDWTARCCIKYFRENSHVTSGPRNRRARHTARFWGGICN